MLSNRGKCTYFDNSRDDRVVAWAVNGQKWKLFEKWNFSRKDELPPGAKSRIKKNDLQSCQAARPLLMVTTGKGTADEKKMILLQGTMGMMMTVDLAGEKKTDPTETNIFRSAFEIRCAGVAGCVRSSDQEKNKENRFGVVGKCSCWKS